MLRCVIVALHALSLAICSLANGPVGGMPFTMAMPLGTQPSPDDDGKNAQMYVTRLLHKKAATSVLPASMCDLGDQPGKKACLDVERGCMWTAVTTRDALKRVQAITQHCMPCRIDGTAIPCWNPGAWVGGLQVLECAMSCMHQQRIWQPQYACSDETGFISNAQCFDRAAKSGSKCMFIAYEDSKGEPRASCGPCELSGSGGWGCPAVGSQGPADGSKITSCLSQCDVLCAGPPACPPTVAPPPPPPPQQSPGLPDTASAEDVMVTAPVPWLPLPAPDPNAIIEAAREAAKRAGFVVMPPPPPPKVYWPVIFYRSPGDYLFTTGPPPMDGPEAPQMIGLVQTAKSDKRARNSFLMQGPTAAPNAQRMPRLRSVSKTSVALR